MVEVAGPIRLVQPGAELGHCERSDHNGVVKATALCFEFICIREGLRWMISRTKGTPVNNTAIPSCNPTLISAAVGSGQAMVKAGRSLLFRDKLLQR